MEKVLEPYNLPRLKHEKIENLNILITSEEIESVMKNLPIKRSHGDFPGGPVVGTPCS